MPEEDGLSVVRAVKQSTDVPIIMVSARDSEFDKVRGLEIGADDYVTKPYSMRELLARIRAVLRRRVIDATPTSSVLRAGPVRMDIDQHVVSVDGVPMSLPLKEFQLLEFMLLNPERVVRRTELLEKVWDLSFDPMSNVVDVHVGHLRQKLGGGDVDHVLKTVRGVGYLLQIGSDE